MSKEYNDDFVETTNHPFNFSILYESLGAWKMELNAIGGSKLFKGEIFKFPNHDTLKSFYFGIKLGVEKWAELKETRRVL